MPSDIEALILETEGKPSCLESLTKTREIQAGGMSADILCELQAHMTDEQMVDLTVIAAFSCAVVRTRARLALDVEPEVQP